MLARLEMILHSLAKSGINRPINVIGQFPPNLNATDFDCTQVTRASLSSSSHHQCSTIRRIPAPKHRASAVWLVIAAS